MNRLQQSRRQSFGFVYPNQVSNNIVKPTRYRNNYDIMAQASNQSSGNAPSEDQSGAGVMDLARSILAKGKQAASLGSDLYASDIGKAVQNIIPSSDENSRPGFAGERHAILHLPNGKYGVANYMGPGTQVIQRLKRGDPPRTLSDKVAQRHDIDYALAQAAPDKPTQERMIREADRRMVSSLDKIDTNKSDSAKNIFQGRRLIQGKMAAEDVGLMKKGSFSGELKKISPADMLILKSNKDTLEQEGYGLPAQQLKLKLLKQHRRSKKGKGLNLAGGALRLAGQRGPRGRGKKLKGVSMGKTYGSMKNYEMKGKGLSLAGGMYMGTGDIMAFLMKGVIPSLAKSVGVASEHIPLDKITPIVFKSVKQANGDIPKLITNVSKVILPVLTQGKVKSLKLGLSGNGVKDVLSEVSYRVQKPLATGLWKALKWYMNKMNPELFKGSGLKIAGSGLKGFFKGFAQGFKSVFKPAGKILGAVATATGRPEMGIPLTMVSDMI